jgi:hypothetical protein
VPQQTYKRLARGRLKRKTGRAGLLAPRQSLWLGSDHLLAVEGASYYEDYKRFYFRDIQAIFMHPTSRRATWNGILAPLLIMHVLVLTYLGAPTLVTAIVAVLLGIPLFLNNLRGTACRVYLRTAVQVEELAALGRVRQANIAIAQLRAKIAAAQSETP